MGKVRINTIGDTSLEEKQKLNADKRKESKKVSKDAEAVVVVEKEETKTEGKNAISTKQKKSSHSQKYHTAVGLLDKTKTYSLSDGVALLEKIHLAKFDETVELHINTHESGVHGSVTLPHGTGKKFQVAIISPSKDPEAAEALLKQIESGNITFDVLIATPDAMPKLAKFARTLGPRGLMPNPKTGTVTTKPDEVAKKFAGGQVNFKTESKIPVIHLSVGKLSFAKEQLVENIKVAVNAIQNKNIKNITLKSTMSPGIRIQVA